MKRFNQAVEKLYTAFNAGTLDQNKCSACAVGNIVGHGHWDGGHNETYNYKNQSKTEVVLGGRRATRIEFYNPSSNQSGYTAKQLAKVEGIFLDTFVGVPLKDELNPEHQYNGLMNVIAYLAELDNIEEYKAHEESFRKILNRSTNTKKEMSCQ